MLSEGLFLRCPNNAAHATFLVSAHVVEEWLVDDKADFMEVSTSLETTHPPDRDSSYLCSICGDSAEVVEVIKPRICDNCNRTWDISELQPIKNIEERVAEGAPMPSGECPGCGALAYKANR